MNKVCLIGRLVADPEIRNAQNGLCVARYRIAVDRKFKQEGEDAADFLNVVAFGKNGEFAEKYLKKGMKIAIEGRIQTGSYTNKDGQNVYTFDIVAEGHDFCETKNASNAASTASSKPVVDENGFMNIPDGVDDEGLPFN